MKRSLSAMFFAATLPFALHPGAARAQAPAGRMVRGTVYDSLAQTPLAGAQVVLISRSDSSAAPRSTTSDAAGHFEFANVPGGIYLVGFQHPLLDSLGINAAPRQLQLAATGDAAVAVPLAVPSERTVHDAFCPQRAPNDSTSVLIGHLGDASTRGVIAGGVIDASWIHLIRETHTVAVDPGDLQTKTTDDGWYALCDLPPATNISVRAARDRDSSGVVTIRTPSTRGLVRREMFLAVADHGHNGSISGVVVDALTHQPIGNAQLRLQGSTSNISLGGNGAFTLNHLPYGTTSITVRAIGYLPQERDVDVIAGDRASVTVAMQSLRNMLDTVHVVADQLFGDDHGFSHRKQVGWGKFFDFRDIDRIQPSETADLIRRVAGARIVTNAFTSRIVMRNPINGRYTCTPRFFLDGSQLTGIRSTTDLEMMVQPEQLAGMEVYTDMGAIPPEFTGASPACGAIVMWTLPADVWAGHGH